MQSDVTPLLHSLRSFLRTVRSLKTFRFMPTLLPGVQYFVIIFGELLGPREKMISNIWYSGVCGKYYHDRCWICTSSRLCLSINMTHSVYIGYFCVKPYSVRIFVIWTLQMISDTYYQILSSDNSHPWLPSNSEPSWIAFAWTDRPPAERDHF